MIVVNYPSSVLELLFREFLVFMCKPSKTKPNKQKKQYFFFFEFMDHSKVRFASIVDRINSSFSLKSLLDLTFFLRYRYPVQHCFYPFSSLIINLAQLPGISRASGGHLFPRSLCCPVEEICRVPGPKEDRAGITMLLKTVNQRLSAHNTASWTNQHSSESLYCSIYLKIRVKLVLPSDII